MSEDPCSMKVEVHHHRMTPMVLDSQGRMVVGEFGENKTEYECPTKSIMVVWKEHATLHGE